MLTSEIAKFEKIFLEYMKNSHKDIVDDIRSTGKLSKENDERLGKILSDWVPQSGLLMKA